uniref:Uncharacterized protein n=1 Tax=Bactrocera dorsalis TaxID=27457 RepID=A0A034WT98_BACDO
MGQQIRSQLKTYDDGKEIEHFHGTLIAGAAVLWYVCVCAGGRTKRIVLVVGVWVVELYFIKGSPIRRQLLPRSKSMMLQLLSAVCVYMCVCTVYCTLRCKAPTTMARQVKVHLFITLPLRNWRNLCCLVSFFLACLHSLLVVYNTSALHLLLLLLSVFMQLLQCADLIAVIIVIGGVLNPL